MEVAASAVAQFNYQQNTEGLSMEPVIFQFDPASVFATSVEDDWTAIKLFGDVNATWGRLDMEPFDMRPTKYVNIIQHPNGGPKQIALYHNLVAYLDQARVQYLTDTEPGSSGAPVFDSQWRLVALHHSGGWLHEPGHRTKFYRNEGININRVIDGLKQHGLL